jgi:uncharacterized membrane protein HdeD (DUF308 family)
MQPKQRLEGKGLQSRVGIANALERYRRGGSTMLGSSFMIIRGIVGIVVGFLALAWPGLTIAVLVGIFAIYALIDGAVNLFLALSRADQQASRPWAHFWQGLVGIAVGVMAFTWPGMTALALIWLIAAWAVITGALEVAAAIRLRRVISGEWLLALSGILSIVFGALVFAFPGAGAIGIAWLLGIYAIATGILLVVLGIRLQSERAAA